MSELIVEFTDIQKELEPYFAGKTIKITVEGNIATISAQNAQKRVLKARGAFSGCADA